MRGTFEGVGSVDQTADHKARETADEAEPEGADCTPEEGAVAVRVVRDGGCLLAGDVVL
ncbi:MAG: hypothetical protein H0W36_00395 [Gemmatimonadetes bacterium]|nr:hypothetical protein [Gemmatimonadota bacterium]